MLSGYLSFLTDSEIDTIHGLSLRLLENVGIEIPVAEVCELLKKHGAKLDGQRVRLPPRMIEEALKLAPGIFTIHARNPDRSVIVGGENSIFVPGYGAPFLMDYEVGPRKPTLQDYENLTRIVDSLEHMDMSGHLLVEPQDVPASTAHLHMLRASMSLSDKPFIGSTAGSAGAQASVDMAGILFGDQEGLKGRPVMISLINTLSPLGYAAEMIDALMVHARWGQPIVVAAMAQAGATAPVTMAGVLVQQNAEILAGITLAQTVNPGTPVVYGCTSTSMDMNTAQAPIGSPEYSMFVVSHAQMARFYGLPSRSGGCLTDSQVVDAQAGMESMLSLLSVVNSGIHFVLHAGGILGSYLTFSYEKLVIDAEICGMVRRYKAGYRVTDEDLAYDVIAEVGPGGNYLMHDHTLRHFRTAFYRPVLCNRDALPAWEMKGRQDMAKRANTHWKRLLAEHVIPEIDQDVRRRLDQYVSSQLVAIT